MTQQEEPAAEPSVGAPPDIGALYLEHRDAMYGMALSLLRGDADRAEDVVQDAIVSVLRKPPTAIRNWEAFLVHAVKMRVYDLWKSKAQQHERLVLEDATPLENELGGEDMAQEPGVVLQQAWDRARTVTRVGRAVAELQARDPEAAYAYVQVKAAERTSGDVAEELGVSSSRVRQLVMKARQELAGILEEGVGDERT